MILARLIGCVFILWGGIVCARSANEIVTGLESCFQAARITDAICAKLQNDPAQRLDCVQKTRAVQLECLEHVLSETPADPPSPKTPSETARSEPPATASPEASSERGSPEQPGRTGSSEMSPGNPAAEKSNSPPITIGRTNPPELPGSSEMPSGTIRSDGAPKTVNVPVQPTDTNWVVSETTSPIDYSPLVTALIRSASQVKDAPNTLTVRCRGQHTELLARTDGAWGTTRRNELHVDYQINDQPAVGLQWILSSDGKTVTYKDDPVGLLQSLPDGARLKINVADKASSSHEAMFRLDGWDAVRKKIGTACKWARTADKASSDKR